MTINIAIISVARPTARRAFCLGAASTLAILVGTSVELRAQANLPPVTVDAPAQRQARPTAIQPSSRATTTRATRANRAARAPQAVAPSRFPSDNSGVERANGPVTGFVATRSGTGTKTDTPLIETPQSVSVITADQIQTQGAQSLGATLRYTAGVGGEVNGGSDTRYGGLQIRGFDVTGSTFFRDGLRLPGTAYADFLPLDPYGAERIEVLKGPASVLYGAGAPGGLLNYVSKLPTAREFGEMSVSGGSFNRYQVEFDTGGRNKDGSVLWRVTGLARDGETQVDFTKDNRAFIAPAVTFRNEDTSLTLLANYQKDHAGWGLQFLPALGTVFPNAGRTIPVNRFVGVPGFDKFDTEQASVGYMLDHRFTDWLTFRQNARYSYLRNDQQIAYGFGYADAAAGDLARIGGDSISVLNTFAIDNQLQAKFDTGWLRHTVLFGVDYRNTSYRDSGSGFDVGPVNVFTPVYNSAVIPTGPNANARTDQTQTGVYLQDQIKFGRLSVVLGGRQDFAETGLNDILFNSATSRTDSAFSGRAGAIYNFDNGIAPYVSYSESFLPVLNRSATGALLAPETGKQIEGGIKYQPAGHNLLITAAVFDITRDNVVRFDNVTGTFAARQTGQIVSRGAEFEVTAGLAPGLNVRGGYAYVDAIITKDPDGGNAGTQPTTVPKNRFSLWTDYTLQTGQLAGVQIGGGVRYVGSTFGDDANTFKVPAVTVFDALLAYTSGRYRFALNVTNLGNEKYVASCFNAQFGCFYAEGRKAIAKLTYRW